MKRLILVAALFTILGVGMEMAPVQAQPYPNRPVQFIIPGPAGSLVDVGGRMVADEMTKILGVQVVCVNKPGAAFTLGTDFVVKSKKDGYTIVYTTSSAMVYSRVLNPETVPYNPDKDLDPLGFHLFLPNGIQVLSDAPWKTFADLIDDARKNPGKFRVATPGIGSTSHLNLELIQAATGAQFTHVPFMGEAVVTSVLGGHVDLNLDAIMKSLPHIESGKMRTLLVDNKVPQFPQYPTLTELGYKQEMVTSWWALYGPAGMAEEAKKVLIPAFEKTVNNPELKARIDKMLFVSDYMGPAKLKKMVSDQYERSLAIAIRAGLRKP